MALRALGKKIVCLPKLYDSKKAVVASGKRSISTTSPQDQAQDKQQSDDVQVPVRKQGGGERSSALANRWPRNVMPGLFSPFFGPSTSLTQMMDTVDRLFDGQTLLDPYRRFGDMLSDSRIPWDVVEDDKCIKLRVDMPGYTKDEVQLTVEDDELVLKADHEAKEEEDDWSMRSYGSCNLRIRLPENVDPSGIKAELKDGVLKVKAPKVEVNKKETHKVLVE